MRIHNTMAHPLHPTSYGVKWWVERCRSNLLRTQMALIGCDAHTAEEWYIKYGGPDLPTQEELFLYFPWQKQYPTGGFAAWATDMSCTSFNRSIAKGREYLAATVYEIR